MLLRFIVFPVLRLFLRVLSGLPRKRVRCLAYLVTRTAHDKHVCFESQSVPAKARLLCVRQQRRRTGTARQLPPGRQKPTDTKTQPRLGRKSAGADLFRGRSAPQGVLLRNYMRTGLRWNLLAPTIKQELRCITKSRAALLHRKWILD